jgi:hypothetical protein
MEYQKNSTTVKITPVQSLILADRSKIVILLFVAVSTAKHPGRV